MAQLSEKTPHKSTWLIILSVQLPSHIVSEILEHLHSESAGWPESSEPSSLGTTLYNVRCGSGKMVQPVKNKMLGIWLSR